MQEGQALREVRRSVGQDLIDRYARVSGDGNLIHLDADVAARGPFGRIVAHGMLVLAFLSEMMSQSFGNAWVENGRLKVRFRAPVYPGDEVETFGQVTKLLPERNGWLVLCRVGCRKQGGQEVIAGEAYVFVDSR